MAYGGVNYLEQTLKNTKLKIKYNNNNFYKK